MRSCEPQEAKTDSVCLRHAVNVWQLAWRAMSGEGLPKVLQESSALAGGDGCLARLAEAACRGGTDGFRIALDAEFGQAWALVLAQGLKHGDPLSALDRVSEGLRREEAVASLNLTEYEAAAATVTVRVLGAWECGIRPFEMVQVLMGDDGEPLLVRQLAVQANVDAFDAPAQPPEPRFPPDLLALLKFQRKYGTSMGGLFDLWLESRRGPHREPAAEATRS